MCAERRERGERMDTLAGGQHAASGEDEGMKGCMEGCRERCREVLEAGKLRKRRKEEHNVRKQKRICK